MVTRIRRLESYPEMLMRLAGTAGKRGIRIYSYEPTGDFYSTSRSKPDSLHRVTRWSCDCAGFKWLGRCTHHAALLEHIGELPPTPTPEPGSPALPAPYLAEAA